MVFAFTMPAGILFASCSAAAVPAEGSGDSGFITLLDPANGNLSSIFITPVPPEGLGWAIVTPSQYPLAWVLTPAHPQDPILWHWGVEQQL